MIKKQWKTIHSDIDARDIDKAVKRGTEKQLPNQKTVQDVIKQAALHKNMTGVFTEFFNNNDAFRHYFVYEAASGYRKFGNGKATANKMIEFDPTGHVLSENIDIGGNISFKEEICDSLLNVKYEKEAVEKVFTLYQISVDDLNLYMMLFGFY